MGRRGQGEMERSKVSSDAMPALTGRRCVGTVQRWSFYTANKVVPQNVLILSLFPYGNKDFFISERSKLYDQEITGKTMVTPMEAFP